MVYPCTYQCKISLKSFQKTSTTRKNIFHDSIPLRLRGNRIKKNCSDNFVIKWNHTIAVLAVTAVVGGYDRGSSLQPQLYPKNFLKIKWCRRYHRGWGQNRNGRWILPRFLLTTTVVSPILEAHAHFFLYAFVCPLSRTTLSALSLALVLSRRHLN